MKCDECVTLVNKINQAVKVLKNLKAFSELELVWSRKTG